MSALQILKIISSMLGGLALFLTGMNLMSDSLSSMTGGALDRLRDVRFAADGRVLSRPSVSLVDFRPQRVPENRSDGVLSGTP